MSGPSPTAAARVAAAADQQSAEEIDAWVVRQAEERKKKLTESWGYFVIVCVLFLFLLLPYLIFVVEFMGKRGGGKTMESGAGTLAVYFRPILAYTLVVYLGLYVVTSILSVADFPVPDFLTGVVATVIGFYFGARDRDEGGGSQAKAGTVRGTVKTPQGSPAVGATVKFTRDDKTLPYSRIANTDGRFEVTGVAVGVYTIQAELGNYAPNEPEEVNIIDGADLEVALALQGAQEG